MATSHVIVVGAGLKGLYAAHRLQSQGIKVTVLEHQSRAGGKVLTHRSFDGSAYTELGAMRFLKEHATVVRLLQDASLHTRAHIDDNPYAFFSIDGVYGRIADLSLSKLIESNIVTMEDVESSGVPTDASLNFYVEHALDNLSGAALKQSVREMFTDATVPPAEAAKRRIANAICALRHGADGAHMDATVEEFLQLVKTHTGQPLEVVGGMDQLSEWLCKQLCDRSLRLGCKVQSVHTSQTQTRVQYICGNKEENLCADAVLLTCAALQNLQFEPDLTDEKQEAISGMLHGVVPAVKLALLFRERFWERPEFGGFVGGSSFVKSDANRIIYPGPGGPKGFILLYLYGPPATRWLSQSKESRIDSALKLMESAHPNAPVRHLFESAREQAWDESGSGAYVLSGVEGIKNKFSHPHGRIFFAPVPRGWIEDALLDVEPCVERILAELPH